MDVHIDEMRGCKIKAEKCRLRTGFQFFLRGDGLPGGFFSTASRICVADTFFSTASFYWIVFHLENKHSIR